MKILIAGDYCPRYRVLEKYRTKEYVSDLAKVRDIISSSDYSIMNYECPVMPDNPKAIDKQGPNLFCDSIGIETIEYLGINCATLANNHLLDYGPEGVRETVENLEKRKIDHVGGGENLEKASQILYKNIKDTRLAIINCCEHEFSIATETRGGANPLEPLKQYYEIQEAKKKADYVIMIVHGGVEHFQYPTKRMVNTYRFFIDVGADAVINHHQHCPCGYEIFHNKPIYYGLGNFYFDWEGKRNSIWNIGYMVKLYFEQNHKVRSEIIPYRQCDEKATIDLLEGKELDVFNSMMNNLCETIQDTNALDEKLKEFNRKNDYLYRKMLEPYTGRITNGMYRRGWLPSTLNKERLLALMDFLICESHHERVTELLERLYIQYFNE